MFVGTVPGELPLGETLRLWRGGLGVRSVGEAKRFLHPLRFLHESLLIKVMRNRETRELHTLLTFARPVHAGVLAGEEFKQVVQTSKKSLPRTARDGVATPVGAAP